MRRQSSKAGGACRYENIVQIRALLEGETVDNILNNWHELLPRYMEKLGLDRATV